MNISTVFALFVEIYARLSQYFAQNRPIVALNIVGVVLGADTQLVAALIVTHDAALQAVLVEIFLQNLKFLRGEHINILAVAATVEAALSFDDPKLALHRDNVVGIKELLFAGVVLIDDGEIFVTLIAVLVEPIDAYRSLAELFKLSLRHGARLCGGQITLIHVLLHNHLCFRISVVGEHT